VTAGVSPVGVPRRRSAKLFGEVGQGLGLEVGRLEICRVSAAGPAYPCGAKTGPVGAVDVPKDGPQLASRPWGRQRTVIHTLRPQWPCVLDMDSTVATFLACANLVGPDCAPLMGQTGDPSTGVFSCSYHKRGWTQYSPISRTAPRSSRALTRSAVPRTTTPRCSSERKCRERSESSLSPLWSHARPTTSASGGVGAFHRHWPASRCRSRNPRSRAPGASSIARSNAWFASLSRPSCRSMVAREACRRW
jgi:hypothetical protein